jgi:hypothetical protein
LQVERAKYQTPECRNVALGHVLRSVDLFFEHVPDPQVVIEFARRQLHNRRSGVKLRARAFLKRHGGAAQAGSVNARRPIRSETNERASAGRSRR